MSDQQPQRIGPHDLGGLDADPIERADHDAAYWERQVDAMVLLLMRRGIIRDTAELRAGIEALGDDVYERLSYYERWAASAAHAVVERGVISAEELEQRIDALRARAERTP